jgi:hypothetical protein
MAKIDLKSITVKLGFIKDYSFLVLPIIITLAGVVLLVVSPVMSGKLKDRMQHESITMRANKIKHLETSAVSSKQAKIEEKYQQEYTYDANEIELLSIQSAQRELISYEMLPVPADSSEFIFMRFGEQYQEHINELLLRLGSTDCPSLTEIEKQLKLSGYRESGFGARGISGSMENKMSTTIRDALCEKKARDGAVYCLPENLPGYSYWDAYEYKGVDEAMLDCWYWQLGFWVVEDVVDTVVEMNKEYNEVGSSPVKRLLEVSFINSSSTGLGTGQRLSFGQSQRRGSFSDVSSNLSVRPEYIASGTSPEDEYMVASTAVTTPTSRRGNDLIDVVHFKASVIVNAREVLRFMHGLCSGKEHKFAGFSGKEPEQIFKHNQITVLESSISPIDRTNALHELYRYGDSAVVRLDLLCEYIFYRSGYSDIKPPQLNPVSSEDEYYEE